VSDHLFYHALIVPIVLVVAACALVARRWQLRRLAGVGASVLASGALTTLTMQRATAFTSDRALWTDTVTKNPTAWIAHNNLGLIASNNRRYDEAIERFELALQYGAPPSFVHNNLGNALRKMGDALAAIDQFRKALQFNESPRTHFNLGLALKDAGRMDEAIHHFRRAVSLRSPYAKAHRELAHLLFETQDWTGAADHFAKALQQGGLKLQDIELTELNEAFATQSLAVIREAGLNPETTNVNGGAIALGHPLGCTGAKLSTQLFNEMRRRGNKYGLVTACVGGGQGIAGIYELLN